MDNKKILRINELAKKQKEVGLNESEKSEQLELRKEYLEAVKTNFRSQLNNIDIVE